jgi:hypothetical protein
MESGITVDERAKASKRADEKITTAPAAPAAPAPATNTITWTEANRRYTLTGLLTTRQLEEIKARLMRMRR